VEEQLNDNDVRNASMLGEALEEMMGDIREEREREPKMKNRERYMGLKHRCPVFEHEEKKSGCFRNVDKEKMLEETFRREHKIINHTDVTRPVSCVTQAPWVSVPC